MTVIERLSRVFGNLTATVFARKKILQSLLAGGSVEQDPVPFGMLVDGVKVLSSKQITLTALG